MDSDGDQGMIKLIDAAIALVDTASTRALVCAAYNVAELSGHGREAELFHINLFEGDLPDDPIEMLRARSPNAPVSALLEDSRWIDQQWKDMRSVGGTRVTGTIDFLDGQMFDESWHVIYTALKQIHGWTVKYLYRARRETGTGDHMSKIFNMRRARVEESLLRADSKLQVQFHEAAEALVSGSSEAPRHAAISARSALEAIADLVDPQGRGRKDEISRIKRWLQTRSLSAEGVGLISNAVVELDQRVGRLNGSVSKAAHRNVTLLEAEFTLILCYLTIGQILELYEAGST